MLPEKHELVENSHRFNRKKHSITNPKAFTERDCNGHSNNALNELCKLDSLLDNYEEPYTNGRIDDELVIKDSTWQVIVKQAQTVLANWNQIQTMLLQL